MLVGVAARSSDQRVHVDAVFVRGRRRRAANESSRAASAAARAHGHRDRTARRWRRCALSWGCVDSLRSAGAIERDKARVAAASSVKPSSVSTCAAMPFSSRRSAEEEMAGVDDVGAELSRLAHRQLEDLLGARRVGQIGPRGMPRPSNDDRLDRDRESSPVQRRCAGAAARRRCTSAFGRDASSTCSVPTYSWPKPQRLVASLRRAPARVLWRSCSRSSEIRAALVDLPAVRADQLALAPLERRSRRSSRTTRRRYRHCALPRLPAGDAGAISTPGP